MKGTFRSVTPLIPSGGSLSDALAFFTGHLGFSVTWQSGGMAGVSRDGIAFNVVENDDRKWAENASFSIGVVDLEIADNLVFLLYDDMPGVEWNNDVASLGDMGKAAWFKDSENNILCIDDGLPQVDEVG